MYYTWLSNILLICENIYKTLVNNATNSRETLINISNLSTLDAITDAFYRTLISAFGAELQICKLLVFFSSITVFGNFLLKNSGPKSKVWFQQSLELNFLSQVQQTSFKSAQWLPQKSVSTFYMC